MVDRTGAGALKLSSPVSRGRKGRNGKLKEERERMGEQPWRLTRRALLAAAMLPAAGMHPARAAGRDATILPANPAILVAGPPGGATDLWADALGRALAPVALRRNPVGGADGVTGANQFEARTAPDGGTALLAPGTAAMAWLVGDSRAQFDAGRWVPVLAGVGPGVLVSRIAAPFGGTLRMAVSSVAGADLAGLLGLDLLGSVVEPVPGLTGADAQEALLNGQVDAMFVHGRGSANTVAALALQGIPALFTVGTPDDSGQPVRDPVFPNLPTLPELMATRNIGAGRLYPAWRATAAAATLEVALVLPREAPAATVALWRRACAQAAATPELQSAAAAQDAHPVAAAAATATTGAALPEADTLLELRRWLGQRHGWRPG